MLTRRTLIKGSLALPLAAPAIAQNRQTEITIYHYQNDKRGDVFKDIIRRFEAANPDVTRILRPAQLFPEKRVEEIIARGGRISV